MSEHHIKRAYDLIGMSACLKLISNDIGIVDAQAIRKCREKLVRARNKLPMIVADGHLAEKSLKDVERLLKLAIEQLDLATKGSS